MLPQVTTRSGTPMPRKLSVASSTTMLPTAKVATTMVGVMTFGNTCRNMIRASPAPAARLDPGPPRHGEQDGGDGELDIGEAHQHAVDPAAEEPRGKADHDPDRARDRDGQETHGERHTRAMQEPAEHVAAQLVGAERTAPAAASERRRG